MLRAQRGSARILQRHGHMSNAATSRSINVSPPHPVNRVVTSIKLMLYCKLRYSVQKETGGFELATT